MIDMRRSVSGTFFLFLAATIYPQSLPSVDVEAANMQITQFEIENESLEQRILLLEQSIDTLEDDIKTWSRWWSGIAQVSALLTEEVDSLIEVLAQIGSRTIVERAQSVLRRYDRIVELLDNKQSELSGRIADGEALLAGNRETLVLFEKRLEQNRKNIALLRAAISKSESAESRIEENLNRLDTILDNAANLLKPPSEREE